MTGPLATKRTLAARMRGWRDDASGAEQRLKDLEGVARAYRRRWIMIGAGVVIGVLGWVSGAVRTHPGTMVLVAGIAGALNLLAGMIVERGWYRWWLIYVLAFFDVLLVGVLVVWFGHGGFVAAFFIAVLPYAFDQGQAVGDFLVLISALVYIGANEAHRVLYGGTPSVGAAVLLETIVFMSVAMALKRIPATLIERIRQARNVMGIAEQGELAIRATAAQSDELGFLEKSFN